jgi:hypothetical protein
MVGLSVFASIGPVSPPPADTRTPSLSGQISAIPDVVSPVPAQAPAFVPDFSASLAPGFVLEARDPRTHALLVQIPMRTAFNQFTKAEGAAVPARVGSRVDTII